MLSTVHDITSKNSVSIALVFFFFSWVKNPGMEPVGMIQLLATINAWDFLKYDDIAPALSSSSASFIK